MWTTYHNIKSWFENWETDLVKLGVFNWNIEGKIFVSKEQLKCIIEIDETCLALDGRKIQRGGRIAVILYHSKLPQLRKAKINTITAITMICGSTTEGEPIPPHFQLPTNANYEEKMRLRMEKVVYFHEVLGTFGWNKGKKTCHYRHEQEGWYVCWVVSKVLQEFTCPIVSWCK